MEQQNLSELMEMCRQKDDIINKLQAAMDATVEDATRDVNTHILLHMIMSELCVTHQCLYRRSSSQDQGQFRILS